MIYGNKLERGIDEVSSRENPTMAEIKAHKEGYKKNYKALSCLHSTIPDNIFSRIVGATSAKQEWDILKEEFQGSEKSQNTTVVELKKGFRKVENEKS